MTIEDIAKYISNQNITLVDLHYHSKASEAYVKTEFSYPAKTLDISIPYHYRRCGLFLDDKPVEIAGLIEDAYDAFEKDTLESWAEKEKQIWEDEHSGKSVTKPFFDKMLNFEWNCVDCDLPNNPNWARRFQDIKELGYYTATRTSHYCETCQENKTHVLLIPLEKGSRTGYETISEELKKKILKVLENVNAYENKKAPSSKSLIPDHKFPEIRWAEGEREENLGDLSEEEVVDKFQLLDNQRNLQKREICRNCYQTNKRGTIFGIDYYYVGNKDWPSDTSKTGKFAESGCVGCPWYDIPKWRDSLNKTLND